MSKIFVKVKGQGAIVHLLENQLKENNLSHAYLFLGEEGSGKEYLAREFSRYILCEKTADDECDSCKKIAFGTHPDFIHIDGEEGIKIEDVRNAIERVNLSPALSKRKVLLFTKAERMGIEAANALLKTIEEPPADSVIILTAISEKSLPETVVSRAQKIKTAPLNAKTLIEILADDYAKEQIEKILPLTENNIGEAKRLLEDKEALKAKKKLFEDLETFVVSKSMIEKFKVLEEYEKKKNLKVFLAHFSHLIFLSLNKEATQSGEVGFVKKVSFAERTLIGEKVLKIYSNLDYNVNLRLSLEEIALENL